MSFGAKDRETTKFLEADLVIFQEAWQFLRTVRSLDIWECICLRSRVCLRDHVLETSN
jgi:hypothetical protein